MANRGVPWFHWGCFLIGSLYPRENIAFLKNHGSNREKNPYRRFTMLDDRVGEVFEELTAAKFAES